MWYSVRYRRYFMDWKKFWIGVLIFSLICGAISGTYFIIRKGKKGGDQSGKANYTIVFDYCGVASAELPTTATLTKTDVSKDGSLKTVLTTDLYPTHSNAEDRIFVGWTTVTGTTDIIAKWAGHVNPDEALKNEVTFGTDGSITLYAIWGDVGSYSDWTNRDNNGYAVNLKFDYSGKTIKDSAFTVYSEEWGAEMENDYTKIAMNITGGTRISALIALSADRTDRQWATDGSTLVGFSLLQGGTIIDEALDLNFLFMAYVGDVQLFANWA